MTEIEQLREEIAKLRERVAVLEAQKDPQVRIIHEYVPQPVIVPSPAPYQPYAPFWSNPLTFSTGAASQIQVHGEIAVGAAH